MKQINKLSALIMYEKPDGKKRLVLLNDMKVILQIHKNVTHLKILTKHTRDKHSIFNRLSLSEVA
ncbi:hypothetical protein CAY59_17375 [Vibrio campbellii]|nr:hypothetical protein CAY59_17375 [Vibrio campbellii]